MIAFTHIGRRVCLCFKHEMKGGGLVFGVFFAREIGFGYRTFILTLFIGST